MVHRFSPLSGTLASFDIDGRNSGLALDAAGPGRHRLGMAGIPLFEIEREPSPDEQWKITPLNGCGLAKPAEALPGEIAGWLPRNTRAGASALLAQLPAGSYFFVRTGLPVDDSPAVLLGNEWVQNAGAHHSVLFNTDDAYAGIVGSHAGRPPDLGAPLLGLSMLNYTGDPRPHAVIFFCCFQPRMIMADPDELLLLIPRAGPLVFDNMENYSAAQSAEDRRLWTGKQAEAFARKLAASSGLPQTPGQS